MSQAAQQALESFRQQVGVEQEPGEYYTIDQKQIDAFADVTHDHQWIHVDPKRSQRESPYKTTIAHGFLSLSLIPYLVKSIPQPSPDPIEGAALGINYGCDRLRFPAAVKSGARIRARRQLLSAELRDEHAVQLKTQITVEIEGEEKPACVAEWLTRAVYP